jgi:prepilin-type N-terminal cleavage/methylation domain-containing protein
MAKEVEMSQGDKGMLRRLRNHRGFTLVELMIVIAITGILTAMGVLVYTDFTAKANDSTALNDAKYLLAVASNSLLQDEQMWLWHGAGDGPIIGGISDWLGHDIPKLYELSPGVHAEVQIINWDVPADPPWTLSDIWVKTFHERGTDNPFGVDQKKSYMIWVDTFTGWVWQNF